VNAALRHTAHLRRVLLLGVGLLVLGAALMLLGLGIGSTGFESLLSARHDPVAEGASPDAVTIPI